MEFHFVEMKIKKKTGTLKEGTAMSLFAGPALSAMRTNYLFRDIAHSCSRSQRDNMTVKSSDFFLIFFPDGFIEMLNYQLNAQGGFHLHRCGSPYTITPGQVLRHHRSAQEWHGGRGHVPSFLRTSILNSYPWKRNSAEPS
jgi:hypothetical protein